MAKLSARGRKELARVINERQKPALVPCDLCNGSPNAACVACKGTGERKPITQWERITRALMSDGNILEKIDVRFQPDAMDPKGRLYSYGWKRHSKAKAGVTAERFVELYTQAGWRNDA